MRELSDSEKQTWHNLSKSVTPLGSDRPVVFDPDVPVTASPEPGFDPVLDLHGFLVDDAFHACRSHIEAAKACGGFKYITIITGLSGQIREEFPRWVAENPLVRMYKPTSGSGAWHVWLTKN